MKYAVAALFAAAVSAADAYRTQFMQHVTEFGLSYGTVEEFEFRFEQYLKKQAHIEEHNATDSLYTAGHNKFSTWTEEEYKRVLGFREVADEGIVETVSFPNMTVASSIDWRSKGAVNPIKDQKQCGSCWAFSSVAALETAHWNKSGKLLSFSEQQLVDCDTRSGGCNGGNQSTAFNYWESADAEVESAYPYTARTQSCKYSKASATNVEVASWSKVTADDTNAMKAALNVGVVSVSIEADRSCFQSYSSGIFDNTNCGTSLDHAVALVGYGSSNGTEYWILRNSWGTSWGEKGYMRLKITSGAGICGVNKGPLYPKTTA